MVVVQLSLLNRRAWCINQCCFKTIRENQGKERTAIAALVVVVVVAGGAVEAATETATATAAAGGALGGTVDLDLATLEILIVELLDGSLDTVAVSKGNETEATRATYWDGKDQIRNAYEMNVSMG